MPEDYRHTEPVEVPETLVPKRPEEAVEQLLPERTWKDNPLLWIGVVVAVFMAVPFLANWATRTPPGAGARNAQAASAPPAAPEPLAAEGATPQRTASAPAVPDRPAPLPARALADPGRQMVTKCVERGRVVYTQTGECAGSVSAVPIDTSKNVVGPGGAASR
jgi:hypothetical protein